MQEPQLTAPLSDAGPLSGAESPSGRRPDPRTAARAVVAERHPDARAAFLAGSVLTERRTARSDLDVVVLLDGPPAPYRESLLHEGWPVELFVHTVDTWRDYTTREIAQRRSALLFMCADGTPILDADGTGAEIAARAQELAAAGPPRATRQELDDRRYALTDLLDDLEGDPPPAERLFVVTHIAGATAELALLLDGAWLGGGKWLPRRLAAIRPALPGRLEAAVRAALTGDDGGTARLTRLVDEVLDEAGGRLWAGYRRSGTGETRKSRH
ncbi:nucleotidyltransferase domain-containing protein [Streptomyces sp. Da 82-17]|uniref:nucleotidyltransferase domain-containing protein n=1 Tax=Streptomyces sp. Da 82-17 TaxID=3377116 RepID=UPI0038D3CF8F